MLDRPVRQKLSALDLARRVEAGELTPEAVVDLCAAAIAAREDEVGAFTHLDLDGARKHARKNAGPLSAGPLRGLAGRHEGHLRHRRHADRIRLRRLQGTSARGDAAAVSMVRRAGGLILGKTVTTEFAHMQPGKTRNPVNLAHTPGGSSSGSAAAVAAGMVPIATGSQTGGSVIRPAAYCGIAGFKPSYKLLPTIGMKCFSWSLDTVGLFAAGVADVAFATAAISGRDLRVDRATPSAPRIAFARTHIFAEASPDMQNAVEHAAQTLAKAGASVKETALPPILEDAWRAHPVIQWYEACRALAFEYDNRRELIGPFIRDHLAEGASVTHDAYDDARRTVKRARQALADLMGEYDAILTPSAPGAAPHGLGSTGRRSSTGCGP